MNNIDNRVDVNNIYRPQTSMREANLRGKPDNGIKIGPSVVLGSLLGLGAWSNGKRRQEEMDSLPVYFPEPRTVRTNENSPSRMTDKNSEMSGNFYKDTQNIIENLGVSFTPIGVSYTLKNKGQNVGIDMIESGEMNDTLKSQWAMKNEDYFKNLMLMKIYSDAKLAEQAFTARLIETQSNKTRKVKKKASENNEDFYDDFIEKTASDMGLTFMDMDNYIESACEVISKNAGAAEIFEKIAEEVYEDEDDAEIVLELPRNFDKYADLVDPDIEKIAFRPIGFKTNKSKLCNYRYLNKNLNVGFMPDRVLYVADNQVIGTIPLQGMNEDGYEHFLKDDKKYFKTFFMDEAKKGLKNMKEFSKQAEESENFSEKLSPSDIFLGATVHPVLYLELLTARYGEAWFSLDPFVLIKMIEVDFALTEPINSIALNKIMAIQTANIAETAYTNHHAFEKVIRTFSDKPIDFERRENEDLGIYEIAFGTDMLQRLTPNFDIYSSFSIDVIDYIISILVKNEIYLYRPTAIMDTTFKPSFEAIINERLKDKMFDKVSAVTSNASEENIIRGNIETISTCCKEAVKLYSLNMSPDDVAAKIAGGLPENIQNIVRLQIKLQAALDQKLKAKSGEMLTQLKIYQINTSEGQI